MVFNIIYLFVWFMTSLLTINALFNNKGTSNNNCTEYNSNMNFIKEECTSICSTASYFKIRNFKTCVCFYETKENNVTEISGKYFDINLFFTDSTEYFIEGLCKKKLHSISSFLKFKYFNVNISKNLEICNEKCFKKFMVTNKYNVLSFNKVSEEFSCSCLKVSSDERKSYFKVDGSKTLFENDIIEDDSNSDIIVFDNNYKKEVELEIKSFASEWCNTFKVPGWIKESDLKDSDSFVEVKLENGECVCIKGKPSIKIVISIYTLLFKRDEWYREVNMFFEKREIIESSSSCRLSCKSLYNTSCFFKFKDDKACLCLILLKEEFLDDTKLLNYSPRNIIPVFSFFHNMSLSKFTRGGEKVQVSEFNINEKCVNIIEIYMLVRCRKNCQTENNFCYSVDENGHCICYNKLGKKYISKSDFFFNLTSPTTTFAKLELDTSPCLYVRSLDELVKLIKMKKDTENTATTPWEYEINIT